MNHSADTSDDSTAGRARNRLRWELILASIWLAVGLFVLPAVIFGVGIALLGPYGDGQGLGTFYADFFAGLAEPQGRVWAITLGPLILMSLLRVIFLGRRRGDDDDHEDAAPRKEARRATPVHTRVEPRVEAD